MVRRIGASWVGGVGHVRHARMLERQDEVDGCFDAIDWFGGANSSGVGVRCGLRLKLVRMWGRRGGGHGDGVEGEVLRL